MNKLVGSIREAIIQSGLKDGMTISISEDGTVTVE